jgi:hypothetical protein
MRDGQESLCEGHLVAESAAKDGGLRRLESSAASRKSSFPFVSHEAGMDNRCENAE